MLKLFIFPILIAYVQTRIHQLKLENDVREQVTISTFGFLRDGIFQVDVNKFSLNPSLKIDDVRRSYGFIFEKNKNRGFSSFTTSNSKSEDFCTILEKHNKKKIPNLSDKLNDREDFDQDAFVNELVKISKNHLYSFVVFHLDLVLKQANIVRIGRDLAKIVIKQNYGSNLNNKPTSKTIIQNSSLVEENEDFLQDQINYEDYLVNKIPLNTKNHSWSFKFEIDINTYDEEGLYLFSLFNCFQPNLFGQYPDSMNNKTKKKSNDFLDISMTEFTNQYNKINDEEHYGFSIDLVLSERNQESYLSAGELPVPTLYLTWSIIYFLAALSWMYILRSSKGDVFKIHYLMLALVFIKSLTLTFHAINMHYIAMNGTHEAIWAILYYITYVLRGLLLIISILLVGTGWTFIKYVLSENERRMFMIVVPLQILAIVAYIFLEEREEGEAVYVTWRQLFFLLDLICCAAILFPIVWSIKHLEAATQTDGKMVINLKKLKIFKHFYIMVICYVYFTRIIGFLLKQVIPFRYEWFDELSTEIVTFIFFVMTAIKFQPQSNNPYLQLNQEEFDDENGNNLELRINSQSQHLLADFDDEFNTDTIFDATEQKNGVVITGTNGANNNLQSRKQTY